eukprot:3033042-Lingulodinium_polyedra.AAC.1
MQRAARGRNRAVDGPPGRASTQVGQLPPPGRHEVAAGRAAIPMRPGPSDDGHRVGLRRGVAPVDGQAE